MPTLLLYGICVFRCWNKSNGIYHTLLFAATAPGAAAVRFLWETPIAYVGFAVMGTLILS